MHAHQLRLRLHAVACNEVATHSSPEEKPSVGRMPPSGRPLDERLEGRLAPPLCPCTTGAAGADTVPTCAAGSTDGTAAGWLASAC